MKGVSYLIDETLHKRYVQLDIDEIACFDHNALQNLFDVIVAESRKNDERISLKELGEQLKQEGLINKYYFYYNTRTRRRKQKLFLLKLTTRSLV